MAVAAGGVQRRRAGLVFGTRRWRRFFFGEAMAMRALGRAWKRWRQSGDSEARVVAVGSLTASI
jgi:hypothetical protein